MIELLLLPVKDEIKDITQTLMIPLTEYLIEEMESQLMMKFEMMQECQEDVWMTDQGLKTTGFDQVVTLQRSTNEKYEIFTTNQMRIRINEFQYEEMESNHLKKNVMMVIE